MTKRIDKDKRKVDCLNAIYLLQNPSNPPGSLDFAQEYLKGVAPSFSIKRTCSYAPQSSLHPSDKTRFEHQFTGKNTGFLLLATLKNTGEEI